MRMTASVLHPVGASAIDAQIFAGDEACLVRREKQYSIGKLFQAAGPAQRGGLGSERDVLGHLFRVARRARERRQKEARRDTIDIDAMRPELARERLGEEDDPSFRGA